MTRQLPAERTLPDKQRILEEILNDTDDKAKKRRGWLLPVTAAASIAVVAIGALTVRSLVKHEPDPAAPPKTGTTTSGKPGPGERAVSIDRGELTAAEATQFATECIKWVGAKNLPGQNYGDAPLDWPGAGAKVEKILHPTKVADGPTGTATDWTVAVRSGGETYACVGHPRVKDPDGSVHRDYEFLTFSKKYPDGLGGNSDGLGASKPKNGVVTLSTARWLVAPATAVTAQRRIVVNGKPGPWFSSAVVDGVGYLRAWGQTKLVLGDKVRAETRFLDSSAQQVGKVVTMNTTAKQSRIPGINWLNLQPDN